MSSKDCGARPSGPATDRSAGAAGPRAVVGAEGLGLEPGEDAQRLRVALEPADGRGDLVERRLAVVPERRVAEVVREAGGLDQVRVAAQGRAELAADLRALERVGEPRAEEVALPRHHHLRLGREPTQRRRVQDARAVPRERGAAGALGRLVDPTGLVAGCVPVGEPVVGEAVHHRRP
jgi:hypothetical protein